MTQNVMSHFGAASPQELLQELVFAEECGRLISPPCWKTGRYCSGRLRAAPAAGATPPETPLLQRARAAGLKVYPHTFRNEARRRPILHCTHCTAPSTHRSPAAVHRQCGVHVPCLQCGAWPKCDTLNLHEGLS
jgi:hypothetical protein